MSSLIIGGIIVAIVVIALGVVFYLRRRPQKLDQVYFLTQWKGIQLLCSKQENWKQAVLDGDKLVDIALKKRRFKGHTMGERLMAAQHEIKHNDKAWFAHKLRNKVASEEIKKLKKKDVMDALIGFRAVLKDLGALSND